MKPDEAMQQFLYPNTKHAADKLRRRPLTDRQKKVYNLAKVGWDPKQIAARMRLAESTIRDALAKIRHNGYRI